MAKARDEGLARRVVVLVSALALSAGACTGETADRRTDESRSPIAKASQGGVLRVVIPRHPISTLSRIAALDPQVDWWNDSFEVFRCCLLRTLLAHPGLPTEEGGLELHPDLAAEMPEVSSDGLTWTFRLKRGIRYGPPFQDTNVVAADIIRALEREAAVGTYAFYYSVIEGFDAVVAGEADTISGLEAPDDSTLIVHLTQPAGDLANLFAMPATAPIPPSPSPPSERLGVADGIGRYGRFLVATGPYMIEGSEDLDLSASPEDRTPISGYEPGRSLTLVRNPSWEREADPLRPAYVDRIEFILGPDIGEAVRLIERREADLYVFEDPPPQIPIGMVQRFLDHPELGIQVKVEPRDNVRYITMNLAVPPLDDLHVRRAVSYAIDREALLELRGGPIIGEVASHIVPDSMEDGLLASYEPHPTSVADARVEMALSRYDEDRDGRCDASACEGLVMQSSRGFFPEMREMAGMIRRDLEAIGIELRIQTVPFSDAFDDISDPFAKVPLALYPSWGKDFLNASTFIGPLFASEGIRAANYSLVGASSAQLRRWGYDVTSVPGVDERIDECSALVGGLQVRCWAEVDQFLMEHVVPWVPYAFEKKVSLVSDRVDAYSFSQFSTSPALDRISVSRDAS
jgi:peptide/nickel transport system substrate-binding protein